MRHVFVGALVGALTGTLFLFGGEAHAYQVEPVQRNVDVLSVTYAERITYLGRRAVYWETNNGAAFFTPRKALCDRERYPVRCRWVFVKTRGQ